MTRPLSARTLEKASRLGCRMEEEARTRAVVVALFAIIIICAAILAGASYWSDEELDHGQTSTATGKLIK